MGRIVAICGLKRSGKDTIANYLSEKHNFKHVKIAGPLKQVCGILFGFTQKQMEEDEKDIIDTRLGITPRVALQFFGTEMMQYKIQEILPDIGRNFWIDLLLEKLNDEHANYVISDLRFLHEYNAIRAKHNIFIIKVSKEDNQLNDVHCSEKEWKTIPEDVLIDNNSTILSLYKKIDSILVETNSSRS